MSAGVAETVALLETTGFARLSTPVDVGGVPFSFDAVLVHPTSLDMVVVLELGLEAHNRILARLRALGRALDVAESKRSMTVVVVGSSVDQAFRREVGTIGRVLVVHPLSSGDDRRRALAVLLPFTSEKAGGAQDESWASAKSKLLQAHSQPFAASFVEASLDGKDAVTLMLDAFLSEPFRSQSGEQQ